MPTTTDHSLGQPRKNGAYSNRVQTPPRPEDELVATGDLGVYPTDVHIGDVIYNVAENRPYGTAASVGAHKQYPGKVCVFLTHGGFLTADPDDIFSVSRTAEAPEYSGAADYHERLAVLYHPETSTEVLDEVLEWEAEDDFMFAVARHPKATPDQIERASQHHSFIVRTAAVDNETTADQTLARIRDHALSEADDIRVRHQEEGLNVGTSFTLWELEKNNRLAAAASVKLLLRSPTI